MSKHYQRKVNLHELAMDFEQQMSSGAPLLVKEKKESGSNLSAGGQRLVAALFGAVTLPEIPSSTRALKLKPEDDTSSLLKIDRLQSDQESRNKKGVTSVSGDSEHGTAAFYPQHIAMKKSQTSVREPKMRIAPVPKNTEIALNQAMSFGSSQNKSNQREQQQNGGGFTDAYRLTLADEYSAGRNAETVQTKESIQAQEIPSPSATIRMRSQFVNQLQGPEDNTTPVVLSHSIKPGLVKIAMNNTSSLSSHRSNVSFGKQQPSVRVTPGSLSLPAEVAQATMGSALSSGQSGRFKLKPEGLNSPPNQVTSGKFSLDIPTNDQQKLLLRTSPSQQQPESPAAHHTFAAKVTHTVGNNADTSPGLSIENVNSYPAEIAQNKLKSQILESAASAKEIETQKVVIVENSSSSARQPEPVQMLKTAATQPINIVSDTQSPRTGQQETSDYYTTETGAASRGANMNQFSPIGNKKLETRQSRMSVVSNNLNKQHTKLSNPHTEGRTLNAFKQRLKEIIQEEVRLRMIRDRKAQQKSTAQRAISSAYQAEKGNFTQNFDIEKVLSLSCFMTVCYKLGDMRFLLKRIPNEVTSLQQFYDNYERTDNMDQFGYKVEVMRKRADARKLDPHAMDINLLDKWINIPPQQPFQNFATCYGILRIDNSYFIVSELIQDGGQISQDRASYFNFKQDSDVAYKAMIHSKSCSAQTPKKDKKRTTHAILAGPNGTGNVTYSSGNSSSQNISSPNKQMGDEPSYSPSSESSPHSSEDDEEEEEFCESSCESDSQDESISNSEQSSEDNDDTLLDTSQCPTPEESQIGDGKSKKRKDALRNERKLLLGLSSGDPDRLSRKLDAALFDMVSNEARRQGNRAIPRRLGSIDRMNKVLMQNMIGTGKNQAKTAPCTKPRMTYLGLRQPINEVRPAKNIYEMIGSMNLGHLSGLDKIPSFYMRFLLGYMIQMSRTLAHAHRHGLVHGRYNLTKVLVQHQVLDERQLTKIKDASMREGLLRKMTKVQFSDANKNYNFFLTNFEPFQPLKLLRKFLVNPAQVSAANSEPSSPCKTPGGLLGKLLSNNDIKQPFREIMSISSQKIDIETATQLVKVRDVQDFANSIVEIMVAASSARQEPESPNRSRMDGDLSRIDSPDASGVGKAKIPLDWIPLPWCKCAESQWIFRILAICYGSDGARPAAELDTSEIFEQVYELARAIYIKSFSEEDGLRGRYTQKFATGRNATLAPEVENRQVSSVLNNRAVTMWLNLEDLSPGQHSHQINQIQRLFDESIARSKGKNPVALLNKLLLLWNTGHIRDEVFQYKLQKDVAKLDSNAARLMYLLFKKNIQGEPVHDVEYREAIERMDKKRFMISNLAKRLYKHPEFLQYQRVHGPQSRQNMKQIRFIRNVYYNDTSVKVNQRVDLGQHVKVRNLTFSNNDLHLCVLGEKEFIIIEVRSGIKRGYSLPSVRRLYAHSGLDALFTATESTDRGHTSPSTKEKTGDSPSGKLHQRGHIKVQENDFSRVSVSENAQNNSQISVIEGDSMNLADKSGHVTDEPNVSSSMQQGAPGLEVEVNPEVAELNKLFAQYPAQWEASIGNSGKQLALFDRAQQQRNRVAKHSCNVQEVLIVQILSKKSSAFDTDIHTLDLYTLLNGQEVLSFGIDDYLSDQFDFLCCQAKDLAVYIINYEKSEIIARADSGDFSILRQSIFYNPQKRQRNTAHYESLKQYVEQEQAEGNLVRLPKINEEVIAVNPKKTTLIKLYNVKKCQIVRQFRLNLDEVFFEADDVMDEGARLLTTIEQGEDIERKITVKATGWNNLTVRMSLRKFIGNDLVEEARKKSHISKLIQKREKKVKIQQQENTADDDDSADGKNDNLDTMDVENIQATDATAIKMFELSPNATVLAAIIGQEIYLRVLNQVHRQQWRNTLDYQESIAFMPIYLDEDYNYIDVVKQFVEEKQKEKDAKNKQRYHTNNGTIREENDEDRERSIHEMFDDDQSRPATPFNDTKTSIDSLLTLKNLIKNLGNYVALQRFQGTMYAKNEKQLQVCAFREALSSDPRKLIALTVGHKNRYNIVCEGFELMRAFGRMDKGAIRLTGFRSLQPFVRFENFHFSRSFQFVKDFTISHSMKKSLLAVLVNRSLHVYDYLSNKVLFITELSNVTQPTAIIDQTSRALIFTEDDQIIVVRDGSSKLLLISVNQQIESFMKRQKSVKPDDHTVLLEGPKYLAQIDVGFSRLRVEEPVDPSDVQQSAREPIDKQSEDSEGGIDEAQGANSIDYDGEIQRIFMSRASTEYGYLAVTSNMRFTIFYIYEESFLGADKDLIFDCQYRFDKDVRRYGLVNAIDFDQTCTHFVTGTNMGWLCIWNLTDRKIVEAHEVKNPQGHETESIKMVRDVSEEGFFVVYSEATQHLLQLATNVKPSAPPTPQASSPVSNGRKSDLRKSLQPSSTTNKGSLAPIMKKKTNVSAVTEKKAPAASKFIFETTTIKRYHFDATTHGNLTNMQLEGSNQYLLASFQNGQIIAYHAKSCERAYVTDPLKDCLIKNQALCTNMCFDDHCSYYSYLCSSERSIQIGVIDWGYEVKKLPRPTIKLADQVIELGFGAVAKKLVQDVEEMERARLAEMNKSKSFVDRIRGLCSQARVEDKSDGGGESARDTADSDNAGSKTCQIF